MPYATLKQISALATFVLSNAPGLVFALSLDLPIACRIYGDCFIQNYVDVDPSPAYRDYTCGGLTYNGHTGVDFRILHSEMYKKGVSVRAAAPGKVHRLRDGMDDISVAKIGVAAIKGREAGNGVIINHEGGWQTVYAHMRKGSVAVKLGQEVAAGTHLGYVGMSGMSSFPHLHFRVNHKGKLVDPFLGLTDKLRCGVYGKPLWKPQALKQMGYRPSGLLGAGFTDKKPDFKNMDLGSSKKAHSTPKAPAMVFWGAAWGGQAGDKIVMRLISPGGLVLAQQTFTLPRNKAQSFHFIGKRRGQGVWLPGSYRGEYRVLRRVGGRQEVVVQADRVLQVD